MQTIPIDKELTVQQSVKRGMYIRFCWLPKTIITGRVKYSEEKRQTILRLWRGEFSDICLVMVWMDA